MPRRLLKGGKFVAWKAIPPLVFNSEQDVQSFKRQLHHIAIHVLHTMKSGDLQIISKIHFALMTQFAVKGASSSYKLRLLIKFREENERKKVVKSVWRCLTKKLTMRINQCLELSWTSLIVLKKTWVRVNKSWKSFNPL